MTAQDDDALPVGVDTTFAIIPVWVLDADVSAQAVRLYGVLRRVADARGYGWAKRRTLAERLHVTNEKTVDRALAELVALGAVRVVERWSEPTENGKPYRLANGYVVLSTPVASPQGGGDNSGTTPSNTGEGGGDNRGTRVVPRDGEQNESPSNESPSSLAAQPPAGPTGGTTPPAKGARGTRLPADWTPTPEEVAFARSLGYTEAQVADQAARYRDYWIAQPGQKGVKLDWPATWRNWTRRDAESRGIRPAAAQAAAAPRVLTHAERRAQIKAEQERQMALLRGEQA